MIQTITVIRLIFSSQEMKLKLARGTWQNKGSGTGQGCYILPRLISLAPAIYAGLKLPDPLYFL